jgi:DNA-binding NarL/FixJ family response regulator
MLDPASEGENVATIEHLLKRRTAVRHILRLRLQGKSRKEIAAILGKSPHTIDWHLRELIRSCRAIPLARIIVIIAASPRLTALLSSADSPPPDSGG